jgi:hypothetical protein
MTLSIYLAEKNTNLFKLLPPHSTTKTEYQSEWSCDLCYSHNINNFRLIISTHEKHLRVCSECINTKHFNNTFIEENSKIKNMLKDNIKD